MPAEAPGSFQIVMICAAFAAQMLFFYLYERKPLAGVFRIKEPLAYKCLATCMAAAVCALGAVRFGGAWRYVLLCGLLCSTVADYVIGVRFLRGMGVFALAHLLYITAYCSASPPTLRSLAVFLPGLIFVGILFWRWRVPAGRQRKLFIAYGIVLCAMLAFASGQKPLLFAGAALFTLSDALLAYRMFSGEKKRLSFVSLGCYYLAQFLIGLSAVFK